MIIPFKKEHLEVMEMRDHERNVLALHPSLEFLEMGHAVTAYLDGRIVCCGGVTPLLGMATANIWLIPSVYVQEYRRRFMTEIKDWLLEQKREFDLTRMQTVCLDDELHNSWMAYLEFKKEGILEKYNVVDYAMFGRVW